jgi:hypothetical protein
MSGSWLPTGLAKLEIGCSAAHLKRCRDSHGGFLIGGEDYILGPSRTASILWNVASVRKKFHHRGMLIRQGDSLLRQLQGA